MSAHKRAPPLDQSLVKYISLATIISNKRTHVYKVLIAQLGERQTCVCL